MLARLCPRDVYVPLLVLVAVAVALRVVEMVTYSTVVTDYYTGDAGRYLRYGYPGMFWDPWQPAGYALFLAAIRGVVNWLPLTVAIQHALGIATGLLLYGTVRRAGGSRGVALVPAAVVLLSGDNLFLEQAILMEALWTALLAAGLYCAVRGATADDPRWLVASSALIGVSILVRNVSLLLPLVIAIWALWICRPRLRAGAAALLPAVGIVALYMIVAGAIGPYTGMNEMSGWSLYTRVGQFADCRDFTPPPGTAGLCEHRPISQREGPFYYYWVPTDPAHHVFPAMSPADDAEVGAFARAAILHQPLAYLGTVAKDIARYVDSHTGIYRPLSGQGPDAMSFRTRSPDPANTARYAAELKFDYTGVNPNPGPGTSFLIDWQDIFRLHGWLLVLLSALGLIALVRGPREQRRICALFVVTAVVLLVIPPAVSSYDYRYSVPPGALLALPAAFGAASLLPRRVRVTHPFLPRSATKSS
jgi:hypothetical protein